MVRVIKGTEIAQKIRGEVRKKVAKMKPRPKLAVVLIGNNPASETYVEMKLAACRETGIRSEVVRIDGEKAAAAVKKGGKCLVERQIRRLNMDKAVTGILVQLPLPRGFDTDRIIAAIDPKKDVDCLHPENVGRFMMGKGKLVPATPKGCLRLLDKAGVKIAGKNAVVVGRSNIVGRPMAQLLLARNATVASCHKLTKNLEQYTKKADILVVAAGSPRLIRGDMVKKGAVVVNVGATREEKKGQKVRFSGEKMGKCRLLGDVCIEEVEKVASVITPVVGGVGPMTVAMLLENVVLLGKRRK